MNRLAVITVLVVSVALQSCGGASGSAPVVSAPPKPNNAPVVKVINATVFEGDAGTLATVEASDPDGDALSYAIDPSGDGLSFSISQTGQISAARGLDFEAPADANRDNVYAVKVRVSDSRAEAVVDASFTIKNRGAIDVPAAIPYPDNTPTAELPVAALRLPGDRWLVRVRSVEGGGIHDFDEFVFRNPKGIGGVNDGWQLLGYTAWIDGRGRPMLYENSAQDRASVVEFAWRLGPLGTPYVSGGAGPDFDYAGFSHGHMRTEATSALGDTRVFTDASNDDLRAAPDFAGQWAKTLTFRYNFMLQTPQGIDAAKLHFTQVFDAGGYTPSQRLDTVAPDVGVNDSYVVMFPMNALDTAKPTGRSALATRRDGAIRYDWLGLDLPEIQFFDSRDPTVMAVIRTLGGAPVRRPDDSLAPFALNTTIRSFIADNQDFPKFYVAGMSSASSSPVAWRLSGTYLTASNFHSRLRPSGPL
jgi:hypothetical protein